MANMLTAYCMKTKEKNVPMQNAIITKTSRGGYMAQGDDGKGNKMTTMLAEAKALEAVKDGVAKKDGNNFGLNFLQAVRENGQLFYWHFN